MGKYFRLIVNENVKRTKHSLSQIHTMYLQAPSLKNVSRDELNGFRRIPWGIRREEIKNLIIVYIVIPII